MATDKNNRQMPHNIEAEQSLLCCIMISDTINIEIFNSVTEKDFYSESHKILFGILQELYNKNVAIDLVTTMDILDRKGLLESIGGMQYLSFLSNFLTGASNYKQFINIVKRDSVLRQLINTSQEIINKCYEGIELQEAIDFAESNIFKISQSLERSSLVHIKEALPSVMEKLNLLASDKDAVKGLKTGFYGLDDVTNGLQNSDLILLAARPAVGKTSFAMNMLQHIALKENKYCAIFSLEMSKEQLAQRSLCSIAKVDMEKTLKGHINKEAWKKLTVANDKLFESKIYVDDSSLVTPMEILGKCRRLKRERGLDFVVIDYLQLMTSGDKSNKDGRQNEVSAMSRWLKIMARELNIPVLVLSQLSRAVEKRTDHKPILSDLRESGAIEQDADIVMFLHKPSAYKDIENADKTEAELIIAKHRNGRLDNIKLKWLGEYTSFVDTGKNAEMGSLISTAPPEKHSINKTGGEAVDFDDAPFDTNDIPPYEQENEVVEDDTLANEIVIENEFDAGEENSNPKEDTSEVVKITEDLDLF